MQFSFIVRCEVIKLVREVRVGLFHLCVSTQSDVKHFSLLVLAELNWPQVRGSASESLPSPPPALIGKAAQLIILRAGSCE